MTVRVPLPFVDVRVPWYQVPFVAVGAAVLYVAMRLGRSLARGP